MLRKGWERVSSIAQRVARVSRVAQRVEESRIAQRVEESELYCAKGGKE